MTEEHRRQLQAQLWAICNYLRGKVSGQDFKDYILGLIFYKFLSEKLYMMANEALEADGLDYAELDESDPDMAEVIDLVKEEAITALGYHLMPSQLFRVIVGRIKADRDVFILDDVQSVLSDIENSSRGEDSEEDFDHLFEDIDLNSTKIGKTPNQRNEVVREIILKLSEVNFNLHDVDSDVLGDSYEYLIGNFASTAGKRAGEFYTPQKVSEILSRIVSMNKRKLKSVYDPTSGSGSLLLRVAKQVNRVGTFYGQEANRTTYNLARMNMILHGVHFNDFNLKHEDTLESPQHVGKKFDAIVANPPFSLDWPANPLMLSDERFAPYGKLAPKSKADMAFIQHILHHLDDKGTAAVVIPHGVLFRGAAEGHIRKHIIENMNALDAVIGLPENIFFGTGIPTAILVFKKRRKDSDNILFIDASQGFEPGKNQNTLRSEDVKRIIDTLSSRETVDKYSFLAPVSKVAENDYNLNIPRYVDTFEEEERIDIEKVAAERVAISKEISQLGSKMDKILGDLGYAR